MEQERFPLLEKERGSAEQNADMYKVNYWSILTIWKNNNWLNILFWKEGVLLFVPVPENVSFKRWLYEITFSLGRAG